MEVILVGAHQPALFGLSRFIGVQPFAVCSLYVTPYLVSRASRSTMVIELPPPSTRISLDGDHSIALGDLLLGQSPLLLAQADEPASEQARSE